MKCDHCNGRGFFVERGRWDPPLEATPDEHYDCPECDGTGLDQEVVLTIEYTVIDRGGGEFIPIVKAGSKEIYRGSIYHSAGDAFFAALECLQVQEFRTGA